MHVLLVEPSYRTRYPPIGLLKLASHHRLEGDTVELVRGNKCPNQKPDLIYITSLFTWAWKPVWDSVTYYKSSNGDAKLSLGGLYASMMPEHAKLSGADHIYTGVFEEVENIMPAYDLVQEWDGSILFSSRGCNRRCQYCAVWKLEGSLNSCKRTIKHLIYPKHTRIIFWDNNILQNQYWNEIFDELIELNKWVDFNQGLDARLITDEVAERLSKIRLKCVRISYDYSAMKKHVKKAIDKIHTYGIRKRKILVYMLYNFQDNPEDFFSRMRDVLDWGAVIYPMRYEPSNALERWKFVSQGWDSERLELVEDFRRVYGYSGTFPPYSWLVERFMKSESFDEAFKLPELNKHEKRVRKPYHASWQREKDWTKVTKQVLSKKW